MPFEIPATWEWIRCASLGEIVRGSGIKRTETVEKGLPCVRYGELYTTYNTSFVKTKSFITAELDEKCKHFGYGDILMTLTGENKPDIAKAVAYLGNVPVAVGGDLAYWTYHGMNPLYLVYALSCPYVISRKVHLATGDIIVHISGDKIGSILLPIPPLEEQARIVAHIEEIETLLSKYDATEQQLSSLQCTFPDQLKKSILQMAVQGKLVPQDPADEPASVLLERIRAEKQRLIAEGKIKRDKHESIIFRRDNSHYEKLDGIVRCIDDEIPFKIPKAWTFSRLQTICKKITDGEHKTPKRVKEYCGFYLLSARNVRDGYITLTDVDYVDEHEYRNISQRCNPVRNDILISCSGSVGRCCTVEDENNYVMVRSAAMVSPVLCSSRYLMYAIQSPMVQKQINEGVKQAVQANLFQGAIRELLIPIPSLSEQIRIVNQLETIFPIVRKIQ